MSFNVMLFMDCPTVPGVFTSFSFEFLNDVAFDRCGEGDDGFTDEEVFGGWK